MAATSSDWPTLKLPPGKALGNTSTITASGRIAIRYCLIPPRLTYWVANLRPPSSRATPTSPAVTIMIIEYSVSRIRAGAASPVAISAEIRLTSRITTDRLRISEP
ncbi:hypothetical protein D3C72_2036760 [compost metagenome]